MQSQANPLLFLMPSKIILWLFLTTTQPLMGASQSLDEVFARALTPHEWNALSAEEKFNQTQLIIEHAEEFYSSSCYKNKECKSTWERARRWLGHSMYTNKTDIFARKREGLVFQKPIYFAVEWHGLSDHYTGLFARDQVTKGYMHLSFVYAGTHYWPVAALKLFINGHPSVNIQVCSEYYRHKNRSEYFADHLTNLIDGLTPLDPPNQIAWFVEYTRVFLDYLRDVSMGMTSSYRPWNRFSMTTFDGFEIENNAFPKKAIFIPQVSPVPLGETNRLHYPPSGHILYQVASEGEPIAEIRILDSPINDAKKAGFLFFPHDDSTYFPQADPSS